jgi:hypothetical protein
VELADHIVRVEVRDPAGKLRLPYSGNIATKAGRAAVALQLALNDSPGQWMLKVRDTVSGKTAEAAIAVEGCTGQTP